MVEVELKDSPIHGKGVFAKQNVNPGELIGVYEGSIVWKAEDYYNYFVLWLVDEEGRHFGIKGNGILRFLNHDDEPNAGLGVNSPFIYCSSPIKKGEEITITYSEDTNFIEDSEEEGPLSLVAKAREAARVLENAVNELAAEIDGRGGVV